MSDRRKITSEHLILIGLFVLSLIVLGMIYLKPELTKDQGFMVLAQAIVVSGLIAVATKSGNDVISRQAEALKAANDPAWSGKGATPAPAAGETTTTTTTSTTAPTGELPQSVTAETTTTAEPAIEDAGELPEDQRL